MTFAYALRTDQKRCYDPRGAEIPCAASGQDAAARPVREDAGGRFRLRDDLVVDTATGLYWPRDANAFEFPYTWREAFGLVEAMNGAGAHGRTGWRLPSRRELFSLVSHQYVNPALPRGQPFTQVFPGYYWTATPCARLPAQAWYVHLGGARVYRGLQEGACLVWPVSGPERDAPSHGARFRTADAVVRDRLTGRTWTRTARCGPLPLRWEDALAAAAAIDRRRFGGLGGWRLPNIRELESLVDLTRHSPALPSGHPFEDVPEACWSSTTSVYEPRYAWVLYLRDGAVGVGFKPEPTFDAWFVADAAPG